MSETDRRELAIGETDNDLAPPAVTGDEAVPLDPLSSVEPSREAPRAHSSSPEAPRTNDEK